MCLKVYPSTWQMFFFFQVGVKKQTIFWEGETGYTPIAESFMIFSQFPRAKLMYTQIYKF